MGSGSARRPAVLILDDDDDTLASLCDALSLFGCAPSAVHSFRELVDRRDDALACSSAILDVNLGPGAPSGVDAAHWLRDAGFRGEIVFLTGHGMDHPLVQQASRTPRTRILRKPTSLEELLKLVRGQVEA